MLALQMVDEVSIKTRLGQGKERVEKIETPSDLIVVDQTTRVGDVDFLLLPSLPEISGVFII